MTHRSSLSSAAAERSIMRRLLTGCGIERRTVPRRSGCDLRDSEFPRGARNTTDECGSTGEQALRFSVAMDAMGLRECKLSAGSSS